MREPKCIFSSHELVTLNEKVDLNLSSDVLHDGNSRDGGQETNSDQVSISSNFFSVSLIAVIGMGIIKQRYSEISLTVG